MIDRYVVFGNPIAHSLSPQIHAFFAQQYNQNLIYGKAFVPLDGFAAAVTHFFKDGGKGANVTIPFKEQAYRLCAQTTARAKQAQAVNTLYLNAENQLCGDNTDGVGFVLDIKRLAIQLVGARVVVLGAGGAACAIVPQIVTLGAKTITIVNRNKQRAIALAARLQLSERVHVVSSDDTVEACDVIINTTPASLHGEMPIFDRLALTADSFCYDLAYASATAKQPLANDTCFTKWAREQGYGACAGLGMLVGQAAEAFYIWRGRRPKVAPCLEHLFTL